MYMDHNDTFVILNLLLLFKFGIKQKWSESLWNQPEGQRDAMISQIKKSRR